MKETNSTAVCFSIQDALLTRLSNDDDLEKSLSTFANEMASTAMILGLATYDSLVLIDEVGRGTSVREGVAISHAIAEELIRLKVWRGLHRSVSILTRLCSSALRVLRNVRPADGTLSPSQSSLLFSSSHFSELTTTLSRQPSVVKYVSFYLMHTS